MIKYNNKEQFQHTGISPYPKVFKQYLPRQLGGAKMARRSISQESILQTKNAQSGFHPQKRSKSYKINPERTHAAGRMRTQIIDKRQHKSKATLLLILPIQGNQLGNVNPNGISSYKPLPVRKEDMGSGKMKLLAHKSKLRPIISQTKHKIQGQQQLSLSPRWKYHRFAGQIDPKRLLRIHAIQPPQNNSLQLKTIPPRKLTEPNLETSEEFYETSLAYRSSIYDKPSFQQEGDKQEVNFKSKRKFYLQQLRQGKMRVYAFGRPLRTPFETYYYRHMLWKVNFSNRLFIQPPLEYQHRLRAFIGKGNNSPMVRGLLARRYWFAITDHLEDAHFVWTQLKQLSYFSTQKSFNPPHMSSNSSTIYKGTLMLSGQEESVSKYLEAYRPLEEFSDERLLGRLKNFKYDSVVKGDKVKEGRVQNHLIHNYVIGNKKSLFRLMSGYYKSIGKDPFQYIPLTYHIGGGLEDPRFLAFQRYYHTQTRLSRQGLSSTANYWIVKPGENSNRGTGIKVCLSLSQIKEIIKQSSCWGDGSKRTYILQSYIDKPLLYQKRKFDIRHYVLITCVNGCVKGYWYAEGYVRTASFQYNLGSNSASIHLTNDAIQKWLPGYGKFEKGNKISYQQLDAYLLKKKKGGFYSHIYPQMKAIAIDMIRASAALLDPMRLGNNFQLFGLDFMVDESFKVWLIEANSNPCLELSCPLLAGLIPRLIENLFELALDPIFPPPVRYCPKIPRYSSKLQELNRFQLVFDDRIQAPSVLQDVLDDNLINQQEQEFEEQNTEQWQDQL